MTGSLKRNDVGGAVRAWRKKLLDGTMTGWYSQVLLRLQDDPSALQAAFAREAERDERIAAALEKLEDDPDVDPGGYEGAFDDDDGGSGRGDGEWDESQHPRATDGKFGSGGGDGGGSSGGKREVTERAKTSMKDKEFVAKHRDRLIGAADDYRSQFPQGEHAKNEVHAAAQEEINHEAERIHREEEQVGDRAELRAAAEDERGASRARGENRALQHEKVMARLTTEKRDLENEDRAIRAGLVPGRDEISSVAHKAYTELRAEADKKVDAVRDELHASSTAAAAALAELDALGDPDGERVTTAELDTAELARNIGTVHGYLQGDEEAGGAYEKMLEDRSVDEMPESPEELSFGEEDIEDVEPIETDEEWADRIKDEIEDVEEGERDAYMVDAKRFRDEEKAGYEAQVSEREGKLRQLRDNQEATEAYEKALADRQAAYDAKVTEAQAALEALHERQVSALAELSELSEREMEASQASEGEISDAWDLGLNDVEADDELVAHGERALERMVGDESSRREAEREGFRAGDDTVEGLKDAIRETANGIKALSKISGRAPKLGGASKKPRAKKKK